MSDTQWDLHAEISAKLYNGETVYLAASLDDKLYTLLVEASSWDERNQSMWLQITPVELQRLS